MKKSVFTITGPVKQLISLICLILLISGNQNAAFAQVSIAAHNTDYTTNFNGWNGTLPAGYTRYATNNYIGTSSSTTGGVYSIAGAGFGYRPSSNSTATSCWLTGTYQNNTGSPITSLEISYQAFQITAASSRTPNWNVSSSAGSASVLSWTFNAATSPSSPANQTAILAVNIPAGNTFTITFSSDRGAGSGSSPLIGINNVKLKSLVSCSAPLNLAENNVTYQSADFVWDPQGTNGYEYVLDQTATDPAGAGTPTAATAYSTTSLLPLTTYYFHVRTDCGSGNYSAWTMVNFTTPAAPCLETTGTAASSITSQSADITWDAQGTNGFEYILDQTATDPATAGTAITGVSYNATALQAATTYYFHIRTDCGNGNLSDWTTITFTTACPVTTGAAASAITHESAEIDWSAQGTNGFEYVLDQTATDPATAGTAITGTSYSATGLQAATSYYFHIRTACGNGSFSEWTTITFTTACPVPTSTTASAITHESAEIDWDAQGTNDFEYVLDQTATDPATAGTAITGTSYSATALQSATSYYFHIRTACGNGSFSEWTTITFTTTCPFPTGAATSSITHESAEINWDAQGSAGFEYVLDQTATDPAAAGTAITGNTYSATGLQPSTTYNFHVRTDCGNGSFSEWITMTFTTACPAPTAAATNVNTSSADLSWSAPAGASGYEYVVNTSTAAPSTSGTGTTSTTASVPGLTAGTTYYLHVRTDCGGGDFSAWTTISFTTATCTAPTGLSATNITDDGANISWSTQIGVTGYEYIVNLVSVDPTVSGISNTSGNATLSGLTPSTNYYVHIRTNCGNGVFSPWTEILFTTMSNVGLEELQTLPFTAYPNPAQQQVNIKTSAKEGTITLISVNGQQLRTIDLKSTSTMELSGIESGIYILRYEMNGAFSTLRLIIQ